MRYFNIFTVTFLIVFTVSLHAQEEKTERFYGQEFSLAQETQSVTSLTKQLNTKDSIQTQLTGKIKSVCQVKGCWMKVTLDNTEEVFVRFKDYGFFVPTDSSDKEVTINGMVFTSEMSVEDQKHYAQDAGASPSEVAKISKPKRQLRFEADGVLIRD